MFPSVLQTLYQGIRKMDSHSRRVITPRAFALLEKFKKVMYCLPSIYKPYVLNATCLLITLLYIY